MPLPAGSFTAEYKLMQHLVVAATVSSKVSDNYWNMLAFNASNHYYLHICRFVLNQSIVLHAFP
jgi:hypothetical protein